MLACADIEEGIVLRRAGVTRPILVFGALSVSDLDGLFDYALYVPPWAEDARRLLAVLSFFTVATRIRLDTTTLQTFVVAEDEVYQDSLRHWSAAVA